MTQGSTNRDLADLVGGMPTGTKLGKYEIVERLGSGGQSIVYKAYDPLLDRHVAIKQVATQLAADERFIDRFRQIARQLAKLKCEQIVTIHDLIEDQRGLFIVMEFIEGHTIERSLATTPEPVEPKAVLQLLWRIAAGLAAIHRAGIVHRDLKPGNVIVGEGLRVKITDFGVAAPIGEAVSMRLGTTKYMAPELFAGKRVDGRADIYSLGMIAYEILLGRPKFNEIFHDIVRDPHSEALRWMKWHSSPEEVAPPLAEANPAVPAALSAIVGRMMAKDPEERFESVETLGMEIRASFSPRTHVPREKPRRRKRRAPAEAGVLAEGPELAAAPMAAEEGDELAEAVPGTQPLTAEIPKELMSLRKKLIIGGLAAGVLVVAAVILLVVKAMGEQEQTKLARGEYAKALNLYKQAGKAGTLAGRQQKYNQALEGFRAVSKRHPRLTIARQADLMGWICKGYDAVMKQDDDEADDCLRQARELVKRLQRERAHLYAWTQEVESQHIRGLEDYWGQQRNYAKYFQQAEEAIDRGDLDAADDILLKKAGTLKGLPEEQILEIQARRRDIKEMKKQREFTALLKQGDRLAKRGQVDEAKSAYRKALDVLKGDEETLPPKLYKNLKQIAETKITTLDLETKYETHLTEAKKRERRRQRLAAASEYDKAAEKARELKRPEAADKIAARAKQLRHDHYLEQGKQFLTANNLKEAEEALKQARAVMTSSAVEDLLKKITGMRNYRSLVVQGRQLMRRRNYEGALEKFQAAARLSRDAALKNYMRDCRYQIKIREASGFRTARAWSKAILAYNQAKKIDPTRGAQVDAVIQQIHYEKTYYELFAAAEKSRKDKNWKMFMVQIEQMRKNPAKKAGEVENLFRQGRYEEHIDKGRAAMAEGNYRGALAYFNLAKGFRPTPEIEKLIKEAEKKVKSESASSS